MPSPVALIGAEGRNNPGIEVIRLLLDYGADVNAISQGSGGESALCLAFEYPETSKTIDIVKLMLGRKVDVNARYGEKGNNALHDAVRFCDEEIVRHLLYSCADAGDIAGEYGTALQAAAFSGNREIDRFVEWREITSGRLEANDQHTLEKVAVALHNSYEIVKLLLDHGANPNAQGGKYGTALQAAAWSNNRATAQLLIERGAEVNTQGGLYGNALQAAATTPFMWRVDDPRDIVRLLLEHGADVNAQGGQYGTALQAAISESREDIAILLLDHGAHIHAQGEKDDTALKAVTESTRESRGYYNWKEPDITQMFPDNYAYICTWKGKYGHALQMAVLREEIRLATLLLKHGADVNYRTERLGPPLILAASKNNIELATLLLDHGADVNGE